VFIVRNRRKTILTIPGFNPRTVYVVSVVQNSDTGVGPSPSTSLFLASTTPPVIHTHLFIHIQTFNHEIPIQNVWVHSFIHSFSILSDDRSKASSKTIPPHSAIQSLFLQMRISSPVLKVIQ